MRYISTALAALFAAFVAYAQGPATYDINISAELAPDGSALVTEVWDLAWNKTEWYLVKENLDDIRISDLNVSDENGRQFIVEDHWNIDRSLEQKAGRCGIVRKSDGCELCWGVGSAERHQFTVRYRMSNVVKSLNDYDMLHLQFISNGIQPRPQHARVSVSLKDGTLTDSNALAWTFGFDGTLSFKNGSIVSETDSPFLSDQESVILLIRFNKGIFHSASTKNVDFETYKKTPFQGSDYQAWADAQKRERRNNWTALSAIIAAILATIGVGKTQQRKRNQQMFGVIKLKEIGYERDLPFDGELYQSRYVLSKCRSFTSEGQMASALILKMIKDGHLTVVNDGEKKVKIGFAHSEAPAEFGDSEKAFYNMIKAAAGSDGILEDKEFSRWSRKNASIADSWVKGLDAAGAFKIQSNGYGRGTNFTAEGQKQARRVIGFKNYLKDFTIIGERRTQDVALWQDYIIFAALLGMADKVAKELKDIDPKAFEEYVGNYTMMNSVIRTSNSWGTNMNRAVQSYRQQSSSSVGGHGGHSSFGGGGGFSGGGFGGGGR